MNASDGGTMAKSIERRRRSPRELLGRVAEYTIAGMDSAWRPCDVIDVSLLGVGLDFVDAPPPAVAVGHQITLRLLSADGQANGVMFTGEIRNISAGRETLRVGAEFVDLDITERTAIERLLQRYFV